MTDTKKELVAKIELFFANNAEISLVILYGSAAKDRLMKTSDVDIGVAGANLLTTDQRLELINHLSRHLAREIDLVDLQQVGGTILREILTKGKVIIKRDPSLFAKLMRTMWYYQADMAPYAKRILDTRRRKFLNG